MARTAAPRLPDYLRIVTYADAVAAALDEQARQIAGNSDNPMAVSHAEMLRHSAEQTRKYVRHEVTS